MILTWCIRSTVPREWVALLISYVVDGYMFTLHYPSPLIMFISSVDIYQVYHFIILPEYFILNLTHWIKFLFLNKIVPLTDCKPSRCLTDPIQQYADCTVWSLIVINITMIIMNKKPQTSKTANLPFLKTSQTFFGGHNMKHHFLF